jgi:hypothetical protein
MSELRQKIVTRILAGDRPVDIAKNFGIARSTVYNAKKLYDESGDFTQRYSKNGRPKTVRTDALVRAVDQQVKATPRTSIRKLARDNNVSKTTMFNLVRSDLGMRSRAVVRCQMLTSLQRQKRLDRSKKILNWLKRNPGKVIVFSDEKNFHLDQYANRRNLRYIAKSPEDVMSTSP